MLRFRVLGASFSRFGCSVFEFWVLRFRDLGASIRALVFVFECFVFETTLSGFYLGFIIWGFSPEWPKATSLREGPPPRKFFEMNMH